METRSKTNSTIAMPVVKVEPGSTAQPSTTTTWTPSTPPQRQHDTRFSARAVAQLDASPTKNLQPRELVVVLQSVPRHPSATWVLHMPASKPHSRAAWAKWVKFCFLRRVTPSELHAMEPKQVGSFLASFVTWLRRQQQSALRTQTALAVAHAVVHMLESHFLVGVDRTALSELGDALRRQERREHELRMQKAPKSGRLRTMAGWRCTRSAMVGVEC